MKIDFSETATILLHWYRPEQARAAQRERLIFIRGVKSTDFSRVVIPKEPN